MANSNVIPFALLGRDISFRDLSYERMLLQVDVPPDYPEHLKTLIRTGHVHGFNFYLSENLELSVSLHIDDDDYSLSDLDQIIIH